MTNGLDIDSIRILPPKHGLDFEKFRVTMIDAPAKPSLFKNYVFSSRENALAGPFHNEFTTASARPNSGEVFAVDKFKDLYVTDLTDLNDTQFEPPPENVWALETSFTPNAVRGFMASEKGEFLYRNKFLKTPFGEPKQGHFDLEDPLYFKDSQLAISETHWMHFGNEAYEKEVYRVDLTFHRNSFGHVWLYIQNDKGQVSGQYKGEIEENMKIFTNLRGRRFKVKMFVATHDQYPWALREISVGYNLGKSFS
jgi:hypothetical protein